MVQQNRQQKVCPVVLREDKDGFRYILAFEHPHAGIQLVKGSIEASESPERAAIRELAEESGIVNASVAYKLGVLDVGPPNQTWHVFVCETDSLPKHWTFRTLDDGGHDFRFFWHPFTASTDERWHAIFRQVLVEIKFRLGT